MDGNATAPPCKHAAEMTECHALVPFQVLIENKSKFVLVHASSGHKRAVEDILGQPAVQSRLADTKAAEEIRALANFYDMLKKDPERAYYGYNVSDPWRCIEGDAEGDIGCHVLDEAER